MDKLIYKRDCLSQGSGEPKTIKFKITKTLSIKEFKIACIRLALALGYDYAQTIKEFGELPDTSRYIKKF